MIVTGDLFILSSLRYEILIQQFIFFALQYFYIVSTTTSSSSPTSTTSSIVLDHAFLAYCTLFQAMTTKKKGEGTE